MAISATARTHLTRFYDGQLLPDEMIRTMTGDTGWFPTRIISRGSGPVRAFEDHPASGLPPLAIRDKGRVFDLYDYLATNAVAGLVVLKDGRRVAEICQRGVTPDTLWHSCSLAKSIASTLVGVAIAEGAIGSIDDPVTRYVPLGGGYRAVTLRQVLRMCSGIRWNEDYVDPTSDRRQLLEVQARWQPGGIIGFMTGLPAATPPGGAWAYNTGESYLVAAVVEAATGMRLTDYLSSRIWSRIGMAHDARWWCEAPGAMTISGSGMNAALSDYARFGQFVLDDGRIDGRSILPAGWRDEAGSPYEIDGRRIPYGYMWWVPELDDPILAGSFQAEGIYGQYIHINPARGLVVVVASARSKPGYKRRLEIDDDAFFAAIARALS